MGVLAIVGTIPGVSHPATQTGVGTESSKETSESSPPPTFHNFGYMFPRLAKAVEVSPFGWCEKGHFHGSFPILRLGQCVGVGLYQVQFIYNLEYTGRCWANTNL